MRNYMPDVDGKVENQRISRVVVLKDTDKDGRPFPRRGTRNRSTAEGVCQTDGTVSHYEVVEDGTAHTGLSSSRKAAGSGNFSK